MRRNRYDDECEMMGAITGVAAFVVVPIVVGVVGLLIKCFE